MSSNYWRKREEKHIKQKINDDKVIANAIEQRLQLALDNIQKEIEANFANYSDKEDITLAETHKRVSKMDIEAFKRKAKEYVKTKDFSPEANYQLKIYNLTMRVSRLKLLKSQIGLELVVMSNDLDKYFKF
ncbi:phage head morphogenesis protein, partial [Melissococcus plutonius]